jgi:hypothetical protein
MRIGLPMFAYVMLPGETEGRELPCWFPCLPRPGDELQFAAQEHGANPHGPLNLMVTGVTHLMTNTEEPFTGFYQQGMVKISVLLIEQKQEEGRQADKELPVYQASVNHNEEDC